MNHRVSLILEDNFMGIIVEILEEKWLNCPYEDLFSMDRVRVYVSFLVVGLC